MIVFSLFTIVVDQINYEIRFIFRSCYYMKPDKADQNIALLLQLH
jgi:hypothetical protein